MSIYDFVRVIPLVLGAQVAVAATPCPPDTDCSGAVDVDDLVSVVLAWGSADPAADVDGNGIVGVDDLVAVILSWGDCTVEYGPPRENPEAEQIALEMLGPDGPLFPSDETYERIAADLARIRGSVPALADQPHSPAWISNQLIVQVLHDADTREYECANVYYGLTEADLLFSSGSGDWYVLTFAGPINVAALTAAYTALPEIGAAEPNALIGGQNTWTPTPLGDGVWRWNIDDGFHDCFDGCDCHRLYEIETTSVGTVTVIDFDEVGAPWCEF